jgi:hypothetical protein
MDIGEQKMATQVKHCFIVTSAINTKFGVFDPVKRLEQTVGTIKSIKSKIPDATIVVMECCGEPIKPEQAEVLKENSDYFIDYSHNDDVQDLYQSENWDVVKNGTEIMCFGRALNELKESDFFEGIDRIHKMSGRYVLNDQFDLSIYENNDQIVIGPKNQSQFPPQVTMVPFQYMARLWSWPTELLDEVIEVYEDSLVFFAERLGAGGYVDIEHVLAKFLNQEHVKEYANLGVEGQIAPNGMAIKN